MFLDKRGRTQTNQLICVDRQVTEAGIESICPACKEGSTYGVDLIAILSQLKSADYITELQINDLKIKFRPLNYKEMNQASVGQFETQRAFAMLEQIQDEEERNLKSKEALHNVTELTMKLLSNAMEYVSTPTIQVTEKEYILDFLRNCDKTAYTNIRDHLSSLRSSTEIKPLKIKCVHCEHNYDQPFTLNTSDFFG